MSPRSSRGDARGVRLEATIRKALADAWACGETKQEVDKAAARLIQEKFPELPEREIAALIQRMRGGAK